MARSYHGAHFEELRQQERLLRSTLPPRGPKPPPFGALAEPRCLFQLRRRVPRRRPLGGVVCVLC